MYAVSPSRPPADALGVHVAALEQARALMTKVVRGEADEQVRGLHLYLCQFNLVCGVPIEDEVIGLSVVQRQKLCCAVCRLRVCWPCSVRGRRSVCSMVDSGFLSCPRGMRSVMETARAVQAAAFASNSHSAVRCSACHRKANDKPPTEKENVPAGATDTAAPARAQSAVAAARPPRAPAAVLKAASAGAALGASRTNPAGSGAAAAAPPTNPPAADAAAAADAGEAAVAATAPTTTTTAGKGKGKGSSALQSAFSKAPAKKATKAAKKPAAEPAPAKRGKDAQASPAKKAAKTKEGKAAAEPVDEAAATPEPAPGRQAHAARGKQVRANTRQ